MVGALLKISTIQQFGRASGGQKKWQTFFAKRNLGGNFLNWYRHARAPPQDKQFFNLCGVDNTSLLIHYCSILYSNASKMHCFTCSSVVAIYRVSAKNFRQGKSLPLPDPSTKLRPGDLWTLTSRISWKNHRTR